MIIVSPAKRCRPVSEDHVPLYERIERFILDHLSEQTFTEAEISQAVDIDKRLVRKCLYRLEHLDVIKEAGRVTSGRGRPARLWTR